MREKSLNLVEIRISYEEQTENFFGILISTRLQVSVLDQSPEAESILFHAMIQSLPPIPAPL